MPRLLCSALHAKIEEQIERTIHLIDISPEMAVDWTPPLPGARPLGWVFGHLLECLAGFCAALYAVHPSSLVHFLDLKSERVNHLCSIDEVKRRIPIYKTRIDEGINLLSDADLSRVIPTVFVPEGELLLTLLLGNLEHLVSHKYQLFVYLKLAGGMAGTPDLYQFRK